MVAVASLERLDPRAVDEASRRGRSSLGPWTSEQVVRVVGGNAVAFALIAASWFQLSGEVTVRGQLTWLNVGLVGLGVAGASNGLWLFRGRMCVGRARVALLPDCSPLSPSTSGLATSRPVTARGMTRFHDPACPFARDRAVRAATIAQHSAAGLVPCEVCLPAGAREPVP
jgi:hypothetical protein